MAMDNESRYSLTDLARVTGVTPRTVRYYIAQGLLPGANETGPGASYDGRHLARLRLIRELQRQHLPLAEIRSRLAGLADAEVAALLADRATAAETPAGSALDYIRGLLGTPRQSPPSLLMRVDASGPAQVPASAPAARARLMRALASETQVVSDAVPTASPTPPPTMVVGAATDLGDWNSYEAPSSKPDEPAKPPAATRSQWDRIALTDDIELHVRRPLSRLDNKRVERLITIARQVLGEEKP